MFNPFPTTETQEGADSAHMPATDSTFTPWYETPEAQKALSAIAYGQFQTKGHVKHFPLTKDEWTTVEGRSSDKLREIWFKTAERVIAIEDRALSAAEWERNGLSICNQKAADAVIGGYSNHWGGDEERPASLVAIRDARQARAA